MFRLHTLPTDVPERHGKRILEGNIMASSFLKTSKPGPQTTHGLVHITCFINSHGVMGPRFLPLHSTLGFTFLVLAQQSKYITTEVGAGASTLALVPTKSRDIA